jgi:hypothetical protein
MKFPVALPVVIEQCVSNVATGILSQLQTANSDILSLGFMYGHITEILQTLAEMERAKTQKYLKYPVVMLFTDVVTSPSSVRGLANDVTLNLAIVMSSTATLKAAERETINFAPILRPIYQALIKEMAGCGFFWVQSPKKLLGYATERFYLGRESLDGGTANKLNDYADAIEIKGLKLTQTNKQMITPFPDADAPYVRYYTVADAIAASRKVITLTTAVISTTNSRNDTITDPFFANPITEIVADQQNYIVGVNFTINTILQKITGITISFEDAQIIITKI